jgi:ABC-2 type transport system ATP-binding protein
VDAIDLKVAAGRITGFLGPNGAGKTTTISLLLGLLRADAGQCEVLGCPPGDVKSLEQIGALVEAPSLYDHLTGYENLEITRLMRDAAKAEIGRVLALVGLLQDARRPVRTYSLGMKQRLGMALALMGEPKLLILDEPLNGLDPAGILEMRELIRELPKSTGATVFLSSHILAEVEQVASDLVVIHNGKLRYQGPLDGLAAEGASEVAFKVSNLGQARDALVHSGLEARIESDRLLAQISYDGIPRANGILVSNGILVYEILPLHKNLEARFLSLVGDE